MHILNYERAATPASSECTLMPLPSNVGILTHTHLSCVRARAACGMHKRAKTMKSSQRSSSPSDFRRGTTASVRIGRHDDDRDANLRMACLRKRVRTSLSKTEHSDVHQHGDDGRNVVKYASAHTTSRTHTQKTTTSTSASSKIAHANAFAQRHVIGAHYDKLM